MTKIKSRDQLDDKGIFLLESAERIRDIVFEEFTKKYPSATALKKDDRDIMSCLGDDVRAKQGLILHFTYGMPVSIFTPWGSYEICFPTLGRTYSLEEEVNKRLKLDSLPSNHPDAGESLFIYAVKNIEGTELPEVIRT